MNERPTLQLSALLHGADYYPEQWSAEVWKEDLSLMDEVRLNTVTLGVFAWSELEPSEGKFEFGWLDKVFDQLHSRGKRISLATPSAAPPAWMAHKYPEILRTGPDRVRRLPGDRVNYCWTSPIYREKVHAINEQLARRYGGHPALMLWHVSNEYGGECFCDLCRAKFQEWLKAKFNNDLDALNAAYWTKFWGRRFTDWAQIEIPGAPYGGTSISGLTLDFKRFTTDLIVDFFGNEVEPLRRLAPKIPATTNLMGFYPGLNPWKLASELDAIGWDSYPQFRTEPMDVRAWGRTAMSHDLMRTLGGGKPFLLMECSPSSSNWYPYMSLKPPGMHLFETLQAVGHGSDAVMYFQWRQSRGGQEKLHGAVVATGQGNGSKVFRDVTETGAALETLQELAGATTTADVAVIYDWECAWAIEGASGPVQGSKKYHETCLDHYLPFWEAGVSVDVISQECDFTPYKFIVAPMLYLLKPGTADRMKAFVEAGGVLLSTYMTGWVDENDLTFEAGIFSPLQELFGVRSEELEVFFPGHDARVVLPRGSHFGVEGSFEAKDFAERIHVVDAEVVGAYGRYWFEEQPAITRRFFGKGEAIYIAARMGMEFNEPFLNSMAADMGLRHNYSAVIPSGVTVQRRVKGDCEYLFLFNASLAPAHIPPPETPHVEVLSGRPVTHGITLNAYGVAVLRKL